MNLSEIKTLENRLAKLKDNLSHYQLRTQGGDFAPFIQEVKNKIDEIESLFLEMKSLNDSLGAKLVKSIRSHVELNYPELYPLLSFETTESKLWIDVNHKAFGLNLDYVPGTYRYVNQNDADKYSRFFQNRNFYDITLNPFAIKMNQETPLVVVSKFRSYLNPALELSFKPQLVKNQQNLNTFIPYFIQQLDLYLKSVAQTLQE